MYAPPPGHRAGAGHRAAQAALCRCRGLEQVGLAIVERRGCDRIEFDLRSLEIPNSPMITGL